MNRRHLTAALSVFAFHHHTSAKELEGVYQPTQNECPSVEEAIKKMKVPDGYEVRNFASEPMIINPVAMTWDHRGRLWVVELYEYPKGAKTPNEYSKTATDEKFRPVVKTNAESPRDRVIILEDTDNDGKADKRTVFAEGLNLATGILCGYDGVFVGQAPNLFFFRDTNGDDKADEYKTVLTGFGLEDRHELLNSFTWGPDGWLYMTHGVFTHSKVRRPEQKPEEGFKLDAGIFRVKISSKAVPALSNPEDKPQGRDGLATDPRATDFEVYADGTSNPWGVDFDARGNAFVSACVIDHLFHMAPGGLYQRQGGAPENPYAYELLPSIVDFKHFRAAYAGIQIYQGGIYPADTHGHLFIGNIHDNAIHEESLTPAGATFKAAPVRDFLRANDGWFRPVSTQTGPDGFLWIMDWCDKYPCYQNAQANPEGVDRAHGRIWRVCYTGSEEGKKMAGLSQPLANPDYSKLELQTLAHLASYAPNKWTRLTAMRCLREKGKSSIREFLEKAVLGQVADEAAKQVVERYSGVASLLASSETTRLSSLWTLHWNGLAEQCLAGWNDEQGEHLPTINIGKIWQGYENSALNVWALLIAGEHLSRTKFDLEDMFEIKERPAPSPGARTDFLWRRVLSGGAGTASVRHATAVALRRGQGHYLTTGRSSSNRGVGRMLSTLGYIISKGVDEVSDKTPEDRLLPFGIWMALEPILAADPSKTLPWLADLAPKTKPLSQVLTYKTARRITDTRSGENMDLLLAFLDKLKDDDVLTAHALDGMLKAQEAGAVKPAKTDPAPFFARWAASKSADVRNHAGRLATLWGDKAAVTALIKVAEDPKADPAQRAEAIRTLRKLDSDEARAALLRLLEQSLPQ